MSASAPASTRDAVLSLLLERGEEDAGTLADAVGISVQAMRRHLRSLADSGLVCSNSNASPELISIISSLGSDPTKLVNNVRPPCFILSSIPG